MTLVVKQYLNFIIAMIENRFSIIKNVIVLLFFGIDLFAHLKPVTTQNIFGDIIHPAFVFNFKLINQLLC